MSATEKLFGRVNRAIELVRVSLTTALGGRGVYYAQARLNADDIRDNTALMGHYGFASRPKENSDGVLVCLSGNRAQAVIIATNDRRYQVELANGEVVLHDDTGQKIHLTRTGIVIDGGGKPIAIINSPKLTMAGDIEATGEIKAGAIGLKTHRHAGVDPGAGTSGGPVA